MNKVKYMLLILKSGKLWVWIRFFFQRLFLRRAVRNNLAKFNVYLLRILRGEKLPSLSKNLTDFQELKKSGITRFDNLLSKEQCSELREYFYSKKVFDPSDSEENPVSINDSLLDSGSHVFYHFPVDVLKAPYLMQIANSSQILDLVGNYIGIKPTLSYTAAWWSFPVKGSLFGPENFHRDVDDWKFLKLFIYLTDVTSDGGGAHVYVKNSVDSDFGRNKIRRYSNDEITQNFKESDILSIKASAGSAILEDTFGFHKGSPVEKGERLMFQAVYSIDRLPYSPKAPIMESGSIKGNFDKWINREYLY